MKHIYVNFKRFDIPISYGGVNCLAPISKWAETIIKETQDALKGYDREEVEFVMFFPELHILNALEVKAQDSPLKIGCQSVHEADTSIGGNFGAYTTGRPAAAMKAAGCETAIIGHCEERNQLSGILSAAGVTDPTAVDHVLNQRVLCALNQGMKVLYCIGEKSEEQETWQQVLGGQLAIGLDGADRERVVIAYEPVWSIGPGKTPADRDYIKKIAQFIKKQTNGMDVVYGGGLKQANAEMLASIEEIDGGLIALTRFQGEIGFYPEEYLDIIHLYLDRF